MRAPAPTIWYMTTYPVAHSITHGGIARRYVGAANTRYAKRAPPTVTKDYGLGQASTDRTCSHNGHPLGGLPGRPTTTNRPHGLIVPNSSRGAARRSASMFCGWGGRSVGSQRPTCGIYHSSAAEAPMRVCVPPTAATPSARSPLYHVLAFRWLPGIQPLKVGQGCRCR